MALEDKEKYENLADFISKKFNEHKINKVSVGQSICYAISNKCYIGGYRYYYEVFDKTLIIKDVICFDNILDYYPFMNEDDKKFYDKQYQIKLLLS